MAIRINAGAVPQAGRLTMPKGTYLPNPLQPLSNPATSGIGTIAGSMGMNPGTIQPAGTPVGGNPFLDGGAGAATYNQAQNQRTVWDDLYSSPNMIEGANNYDYEKTEQKFGTALANFGQTVADIVKGVANPSTSTSAFVPPKTPTHSLVGQDVGSAPTFLTGHQITSIFAGLSPEQRAEVLASKGFTRSYQMGVGEVWIKTGQGTGTPATSAVSGALDERGRPEFVDPTALERGERVTNQAGTTFIGGADYTNPAGETVSQYAMTLGGQKDPKGRYKWVSTVQKDRDGNWVRVNRQVLRKVHTRSHRRRAAQREEETRQERAAGVSGGEINQLVNMRADYG